MTLAQDPISPWQASPLPGIRLPQEHLLHQCLLLTASRTKRRDLRLVPATAHACSWRHGACSSPVRPTSLAEGGWPCEGMARCAHRQAHSAPALQPRVPHPSPSPPLLPRFRARGLWWCPRAGQDTAGTHSPPLCSPSALTSALFLLPPLPVLSRAVLAADLEGRQWRCHLQQEASPTPPVPTLPLLGHQDPFACASARPSLLLARREPRRSGSKGGTGWGSDTRGQQESAPHCGQRRQPGR